MLEILITTSVIVLLISFFGFLIGRYVYKKAHHLPTGECACCQNRASSFVKQYHKKYKKE